MTRRRRPPAYDTRPASGRGPSALALANPLADAARRIMAAWHLRVWMSTSDVVGSAGPLRTGALGGLRSIRLAQMHTIM